MKKFAIGVVLGLVGGALSVWWFLDRHAGVGHGAEAEQKEDWRVHHGTNGVVVVKIDAATQARAGLRTMTLEAVRTGARARAIGRVVDPGPLAALLAEQEASEASVRVSAKEYERLKALHAQD